MSGVHASAFDHLVLVCTDVERSLAWYLDELGLAPERVDEWRAGEVPFPSVRINADTIIDLIGGGAVGPQRRPPLPRRGRGEHRPRHVVGSVPDRGRALRRATAHEAWRRASTSPTRTATSSSCGPTRARRAEPQRLGFVRTCRKGRSTSTDGLLGQAEGPLAEDVALDLVGAAGDRLAGHRDEDLGDETVERRRRGRRAWPTPPPCRPWTWAERRAISLPTSLPIEPSGPGGRPCTRAGAGARRGPAGGTVEGDEPGHLLAHDRVGGGAGRPRPAPSRGRPAPPAAGTRRRSRSSRPLRRQPPGGPDRPRHWPPALEVAGARQLALVGERGQRTAPAAADLADDVGGGHAGVGQEDLVERRVAVHLPQRADLDARLVHREGEVRDAPVLRQRPSRCGPGAWRTTALPAPVVQTFWPLTTHSSPSRSARVVRPARSEPLPGSLNSWHHAVLARDDRPQQPGLEVVGARARGSSDRPASSRRPWPRRARRLGPAPRRPLPRSRAGRPRPHQPTGHVGQAQPASASRPRHVTAAKSGSQCSSSHCPHLGRGPRPRR